MHSCSDTSCVGNSGRTGAFHPQNFSKSYLLRHHMLKLNITCSVRLVRVRICKVSLTPPPPRSFSRSSSTPSQAKGNGLRLPPHFNGRNALVLDTSPSPCRLALPPRTLHSLPSHSPSLRLPHPLSIPITSPSPRLLHSLSVSSLCLLHPRPSSHHPHPSRVSPLPLVVSLSPLPFSLSFSLSLSSHLQRSRSVLLGPAHPHPRPKSESRSPSLSLSRHQPPPPICEGVFFFWPPVTLQTSHLQSFVHAHVHACAAAQANQVCATVPHFLIDSDLDALSGPRRATPDALSMCTLGRHLNVHLRGVDPRARSRFEGSMHG